MKTNDQTQNPSIMQNALGRSVIAAASIALCIGTASAQTAPAQPAPVLAPATPGAAPMARAAGQNDTVFKRIDADGDGFVSKGELEKADTKLGADFTKYDTNADGKLSPEEFDAMMKSMKG
jgi:EF hand